MLARCDKTPAMSALVTEIAMGIVDSYTAAAAPAPPVYSPDAPYTALFTPRTSRTSRHSTPGSAAEFSPPFALELWSPRLLSQPSPSPSTPRTARSARTPRFDLMALVREEEEHEEVEQQTFQSSPLSRPRGKVSSVYKPYQFNFPAIFVSFFISFSSTRARFALDTFVLRTVHALRLLDDLP